MKQTIALIGAPSSAGAHWPGQEKAPQYLRDAGLVSYLENAGFGVIDYGDLPLVRFSPDKLHRHQQNLAAVVDVANRVADQIELALINDNLPLVIGGDCTIGLGVIAGFLRKDNDLGLLYFDGHVDLNTPVTSSSGILDSMGIAHLLGEPGTADMLSHIGERFPLMPEDRIVLFGYNPTEINPHEKDLLTRHQLRQYPLPEIQGKAAQVARDAVQYLEEQVKRFVVHFDVDVIDFTDLPIADVPQFNQGMLVSEAMACLSVFASSSKFGGLIITEFNPDHSGTDYADVTTFIEGLTKALL
ncbi:MAG: arginase family protein [Anaerolineales bacterium]|jgi:arginase